jgi:hypothetical protein
MIILWQHNFIFKKQKMTKHKNSLDVKVKKLNIQD